MAKYILTWDHGTTGARACLWNQEGLCVARAYRNIPQIYPKPGWVEHDPQILWEMTLPLAEEALKQQDATWKDVEGIGLTNQRETVLAWDRKTGKPLHRAIVWQCRRTAERCRSLRDDGWSSEIYQKTGLVLDPYFSASKMEWMLEEQPGLAERMEKGEVCLGTVDSWILWNLSGGEVFATEPSNASRTMLYNIVHKEWDRNLLDTFGVSHRALAEVKPPGEVLGESKAELTGGISIPLAGVAGDQQAALFGQKCWRPGQVKGTFGTGAFIMMNLGDKLLDGGSGLLNTLAYGEKAESCFAAEGAIFMAGATMEWLKNSLGVINSFEEVEVLATSIESTDGVHLVPAFVGLGAPHWDPGARGVICGLTQGTSKAHLVRAALEASAFQSKGVLDAMSQHARLPVSDLLVDGGATRSSFQCQFLSDIIGVDVRRLRESDLASRGVAYLAGLSTGFWASTDQIRELSEEEECFHPQINETQREDLYQAWQEAEEKALSKMSVSQEGCTLRSK